MIESTQLVANAEEDSSIMPMANKPTLGGVSAWSYSYNETSAYKDDNGRNGIIITAMQFRSYHSGANFQIVIPQTIDGKTVVGIESNCNVFGYCTAHYWGSEHHYTYLSIISVTLPSTIKYIGNNAFSNGSYRSYANARFDLSACSKLEFVGSNAFSNFTGGTNEAPTYGERRRVIGLYENLSNLKTIGANAFRNAIVDDYEENDAIIMENIQTIGSYAFADCSTLEFVQFGNQLTSIGEGAFKGCVRIEAIALPQSIISIGRFAFKGCTMLTTVTADFESFREEYAVGSATSYRESIGIFENCTSLSQLTVSDQVTIIPDRTFSGCSSLADIKLSPEVTKIGVHAFYSTNFSSFTLPEKTIEVGNNAFSNCKSLEIFDFKNVEILGTGVFDSCEKLYTSSVVGDTLVLPETLKEIGTQLFYSCISLQKVEFKTDILNDRMFEKCSALVSVKFANPDRLEEIPNYCFSECVSLAKLDVIDENKIGLERIGAYAFYKTAFETIDLSANQNIIGDYAFAELPNLKKAVINVKTISAHMFEKCYALESVEIKSNVHNGADKDIKDSSNWVVGDYAFYQCTNLSDLKIQNDVIGNHMFDGCISLVTLLIPETVNYIGSFAFANCTELRQASLNNGVLGSHMFYQDINLTQVILSNKFIEIPDYAFFGSYLTSITIPQSVKKVGISAFENSRDLASVTILNDCIGEKMFKDCISLPTVTIPATVEQDFTEGAEDKVGKFAFAGCTGLETVDIQNNYISEGMFSGCTMLGDNKQYTLVIPVTVEKIGRAAFGASTISTLVDDLNTTTSDNFKFIDKNYSGCLNLHFVEIGSKMISESMFEGCASLEKITVDNTVEKIDARAFAYCTNLTDVVLHNSFTSPYMFLGCSKLTSVELAEDFETIADYSFADCIALSEFNITSNHLQTIGAYAFRNCQSLLNFQAPSCTTFIGEGAFYGCAQLQNLTIPFIGQGYTRSGATITKADLFAFMFGVPNAKDEIFNKMASSFYSVTSHFSASGSYVANLPKSLVTVNVTQEEVYGYGAFQNCTYISNISIPNTTVELQTYAFQNCESLRSLTIGANVVTFGNYIAQNCQSLEEVRVFSTALGFGMFKNCTRLRFVDIKNVIEIPDEAFADCGNVSTYDDYEVQLSAVTRIGKKAFQNNKKLNVIKLPDSINYIGEYAFSNCLKIVFVPLPTSLAYLGQHAFENCDSLESIVLPKALTSVFTHTFYDCDNLKSVHFDGSKMATNMFESCDSLYLINFNDVTVIPDNAFKDCISLVSLNLTDKITSIGANAFNGCTSLKELVVPQSVKSVGTSAFANCTSLLFVRMDNSVLGTSMFYNCSSLEQIYLHPNTTTIPNNCFENCVKLQFPDIPSKITSIGSKAFAGCRSLTEVVIPNTVTSIGASAFYNVSLTKITLPFVGRDRSTAYYDGENSGRYSNYAAAVADLGQFPFHIGYIFSAGNVAYTIGSSYACQSRFFYGHNDSNSAPVMIAHVPNSLKEVVITDDANVSGMAFYGARLIEKLTFTNNTTTINSRAFYGMYNLKELTVPSICNGGDSYFAHWFMYQHLNRFCGCTSDANLTARWYEDANYVYHVNQNGAEGWIPNALNTITFTNVTRLINYSLAFLSSVKTINLPTTLKTIDNYAMYSTGLTSIEVPANVTTAGLYIFGNTPLVSATLSNNLVASYMFSNCSSLKEVLLVGENMLIKSNAFVNCTGLTQIDFGRNVATIEAGALNGCSGIELISIANLGNATNHNLAYLFGDNENGMTAFTGEDINGSITKYMPSNISVIFSGTDIPSYALNGLTNIEAIQINYGIESIGNYAFANLGLVSAYIPSSATSIGDYIFQNNKN